MTFAAAFPAATLVVAFVAAAFIVTFDAAVFAAFALSVAISLPSGWLLGQNSNCLT